MDVLVVFLLVAAFTACGRGNQSYEYEYSLPYYAEPTLPIIPAPEPNISHVVTPAPFHVEIPMPPPATAAVSLSHLRGPVIGASAGYQHSFAIMYDGSLWAWGANDRGQLGYGSTAWWSYNPVKIMENVVTVSTGSYWGGGRSYAITDDNTLWTWGGPHQLGSGAVQYSPVKFMDNVIDIARGNGHSMAVTADGGLWVWGSNYSGQLGYGGLREYQPYPIRIMEDVAAVAAGRSSMVIKTDGSLWIWGDTSDSHIADRTNNRYGIVERPMHLMDNVTAVATGGRYGAQSLAITTDGRVWMWGGDTHHGAVNTNPPTAMDIPGKVIAIAAGPGESWAVTEDGNLWAWATAEGARFIWNIACPSDWLDEFVATYGEPQTAEENAAFSEFMWAGVRAQSEAAVIPSIIKENVVAISNGISHEFVITADGNLWARGSNHLAHLGDGTLEWRADFVNITEIDRDLICPSPEPPEWWRPWAVIPPSTPGDFHPRPPVTNLHVPHPLPNPVTAIAAGDRNSYAILSDGSLWAWGSGWAVGNGTTQRRVYTPTRILESVVAVTAGGVHAMALTDDGVLWAWGWNSAGQIGDGTTTNCYSPVRVLDNVISISAGDHHSMAVTADGRLWTWGSNWDGQLGDGTKENRHSPIEIMNGVVAVAAGDRHSLAIRNDGSLWSWGRCVGQLSSHQDHLSAGQFHLYPVHIMDNVIAVSAGPFHSMAITAYGDLWGWGDNWYGQLGIDSYTIHGEPIKIKSNVIYVTATGYFVSGGHTMAITSDGNLWAWGSGFLLGDGTRSVFRQPPTIIKNDIAAVASNEHTMIITSDGHLWAWSGDNYWGVLAGVYGYVPASAGGVGANPVTSHIPVQITAPY